MTATRKHVMKRIVGYDKLGPVYLLRVTYTDGRRTWGVSAGGVLTLCGNDKNLVRRMLEGGA